jgi:hypothetical protein
VLTSHAATRRDSLPCGAIRKREPAGQKSRATTAYYVLTWCSEYSQFYAEPYEVGAS